ncbi:MAG TPA: alpha/beta fold hydrolase [Vicinamibacterales bacterium]|nr:alpha/beta fold hydrolase [Vicinamibacterales bacterium]
MSRRQVWCAAVLMAAVTGMGAQQVQTPPVTPTPQAQQAPQTQPPPAGQRGRRGWQGPMDEARARELYVSNDHEDHGRDVNFDRQIQAKAETDRRYAEVAKGIVDFQKITYRSSIGDLDIPAYLFQPLKKRGAKGHAAMVWVHGGVHGDWSITMWPFVREAVERGYVVICPEYRGSTGYGEKHYKEIDYGGYEIDDVMTAVDYLKTLPHVDADRLGIMGWSHGGYITLFSVFREKTPFKAASAIVPVTNLIHRLSFSGPGYQRSFATQKRIGGLPFEKRDEYIARSPLFHVDKLNTPLLVHVATNDRDVWYYEDQQIVDALRSRKPDLAETKVYVDPPGWGSSVGHAFSRRVNPETLERDDTPEQIDSWNRVWTFFDGHLRPYRDGSRPSSAAGR